MQVEGILFGWFETGLEGMVWALQLDSDPSYDGLFVIDDGDHLVIYSPSEEVLFNGYIVKDTEIGKAHRPFSRVMQPQAKGCWIHWTQKGYSPDDWAELFLSEKSRAILTKRDKNT